MAEFRHIVGHCTPNDGQIGMPSFKDCMCEWMNVASVVKHWDRKALNYKYKSVCY